MYTKAVDLKEFYDSTQGRVVQRVLRQHLRLFWPEVKGLRVVGAGYPLPYLRPLMVEAERVVALMPAPQGAVHWPQEGGNLVSLCDGGEWPIETNSVDRILAIHGFYGQESLEALLHESYRALSGQGRIILVVPNRAGLWARFDKSPFGHGVPYSMGQIRQTLKDFMFVPERAERALFVPPFSSRLMLATAPLWEKIGTRFFEAFGGVNIIEASKQLYAGTLVGAATRQAALAARRRAIATSAPSPRQ
jgi:SAM-dependent methyltransferase